MSGVTKIYNKYLDILEQQELNPYQPTSDRLSESEMQVLQSFKYFVTQIGFPDAIFIKKII